MSSRRPVAVTAGVMLLSSVLLLTTVALLIDRGSDSVAADILFFLVPLSWLAVGALVSVRRPVNRIGWLCLAIGLLLSVEAVAYEGAHWAAATGRLEIAQWSGVLTAVWLPAVGLMGTHLALRLPNGSLLSARWRWWSRASTAAIFAAGALTLTTPGPVADVAGTSNPLGSTAIEVLSPLYLLLPIVVAGATASLVLRYRRAGDVERAQIRWIAFAGSLVLLAVLTAFLPTLLGLAEEGSAPKAVELLFYIAFSAVPTAIGVSVMRYRLYDIDLVINRAVVYGSLTAVLAAAYVAIVLMLQVALQGVTQSSGVAVAGSTLAVSALFRPARARIQSAVDRRFFRHRYDAGRTLEAFAYRMRQQVDLAALSEELRGVVHDTVQPTHVSLWLRD